MTRSCKEISLPQLNSLLEESRSISLDESITSLITASTLNAKSIKFLKCIIDYYRPKCILEFGSGLSTLFFSHALSSYPDRKIISIENSLLYLEKTRDSIPQFEGIDLIHSPIKPYYFYMKKFFTYDIEQIYKRLSKDIQLDLVLIDGPLGYRFGREAPLYEVIPYLTSKTIVILDDANRKFEQEAINAWKRVWGEKIQVFHFNDLKKGLAIIKIEDPQNLKKYPFSVKEILHSWWRTRKISTEESAK